MGAGESPFVGEGVVLGSWSAIVCGMDRVVGCSCREGFCRGIVDEVDGGGSENDLEGGLPCAFLAGAGTSTRSEVGCQRG